MLQVLARKEAPVWAQFIKYSLCGGISTVILFAVVVAFHVYAPEFLSEDQATEVRQHNLRIALFTAFVPANLFAYFANRWLVFQTGRYGFWAEISVFTGISFVSFVGGELGKMYIVECGFPNWMAAGTFAVSSALVNFVARKFLVFAS